MNLKIEYTKKLTSLEKAAESVASGVNIGVGPGSSMPLELIDAVTGRDDIDDLNIVSGLFMAPPAFLMEDKGKNIHYHSVFMGPVERAFMPKGMINPCSIHFSRLHEVVDEIPLNLSLLEVSPPDQNGYMSLGPMGTMAGSPFFRSADRIIVQVNPNVPFINGSSAHIHVSEVDMICEVDRPLFEVPDAPPGDEEKRIAGIIAERIPDGATLQLGIGKLANAIGSFLSDKKDLGVHTELLTSSMIELFKQGVVTGAQKTLHTDKIVAAFCMGKKEDYEFLMNNQVVDFHPTSYVNDPLLIGKHKNFISINNALTIDLTGQVSSESMGYFQHSGTGGQLDFVRGARLSQGGMSFIALKSTASTKNGLISRIQLSLAPGTAVTTPRSDVHYIVTEYGIADLDRKSIPERVHALIEIAHPDFREDLYQQATEAGLISSRSFQIAC